MPVAFIPRWQVHIVSVGNTAKLIRVGRTLKGIAFKDYILMWRHTAAWVLFIEPGTIRVHIEVWIAKQPADKTEHREDDVV